MNKKTLLYIICIIVIVLIPTINGGFILKEKNQLNNTHKISNNLGVKIIRPKPGHIYIFDILEIPIPSQSTIIIGNITCVAEQVSVYPYTVKWRFVDWQYGIHEYACDFVNSPYWRYTYSNFNFGGLEITASFENNAGSVMSNDTIITKKFL